MAIYFAALFALCALVATVGGIAAITVGWVLPNIRPAVKHTRVYGLGALALAVGLFLMAVGTMASADLMRSAVRTVAVGVVLLSSKVIRMSRRPVGAERQEDGRGIPS